ncbi:MAG: ATP-binding protein [Kofleriaceae bacterium]
MSAPAPIVQDETVVRTCDVVFGGISTGVAVFGTVLLVRGQATALYVAALWALPAINVVWTKLTMGGNRVRADLIRGAMSLPLAMYLYVAGSGVLVHLWIPALTMVTGVSLSISVAARRAHFGILVSLAYCVPLLAASGVDGPDLVAVRGAVSILLVGPVLAIVGSKLGDFVDEASRQRDHAKREQLRAEATLAQLTVAIDHRMRMEIELRQAQKLEAIGRIAAGVAHEINTPVQFVNDSLEFVREAVGDLVVVVDLLATVNQSVLDGGASQLAARAAIAAADEADLGYLKEHIPRALARSLDGLRRVSNIVRSMKVFAHPDTHDMSSIDLNHAIECTLTIAGAEYRHVADLQTEFGELPFVTCHAGEVNQAILNILVNAAHAIGDSPRADKGRISVRTHTDGDDVVVAIGDNGPGIPEAIRERVFDPFFTTKKVGHGTGQGLSIARAVVDKHHGALTFESRVGVGTTFFLRLPIQPRAALGA